MTKAKQPETTTVVEAARRLGISRNLAYAAATLGQLPCIRIGNRLLIPTRALDRMLGEAAEEPDPPRKLAQRRRKTLAEA
ncbi:DNA binding domain-containing protein, excisionase family [Rhizobiales bacterium GAS113]|nr:DNA binding domain-containing protein, excisionase family [Rhizobiales bacterium GAS113]